jgi:CBS domain-containing protein/Flp pilus assembly pilin Flp
LIAIAARRRLPLSLGADPVVVDLKRFCREEAATSTTEYAIIITLIAVAIMLGSDAVGVAANSNFHQVAFSLGENSAASDSESNGTPPSAAVGNGGTRPPSSAAVLPLTHTIAWSVLLVAIGMVGYGRYRLGRARLALQELVCGPEPNLEDPTHPNFAKRQEILLVLLRHFDNALESRIEVRHVMSKKVRAVAPETPLSDVRTLMDSERIHHLLVLQQDKLLGVISDRDVHRRQGRRAKEVMTKEILTVSPGTQIGQAVSTIINHQISCLPVIENGHVQGILTTTDIAMTLQCLMHLVERWQVNPQNAA